MNVSTNTKNLTRHQCCTFFGFVDLWTLHSFWTIGRWGVATFERFLRGLEKSGLLDCGSLRCLTPKSHDFWILDVRLWVFGISGNWDYVGPWDVRTSVFLNV